MPKLILNISFFAALLLSSVPALALHASIRRDFAKDLMSIDVYSSDGSGAYISIDIDSENSDQRAIEVVKFLKASAYQIRVQRARMCVMSPLIR